MVNADPIIKLSDYISGGGIGAIVALFLVIVMGLIWERWRLLKMNAEYNKTILDLKNQEVESIKKIIDRYHEGNLNLSRTLSEIRVVLETMRRK